MMLMTRGPMPFSIFNYFVGKDVINSVYFPSSFTVQHLFISPTAASSQSTGNDSILSLSVGNHTHMHQHSHKERTQAVLCFALQNYPPYSAQQHTHTNTHPYTLAAAAPGAQRAPDRR